MTECVSVCVCVCNSFLFLYVFRDRVLARSLVFEINLIGNDFARLSFGPARSRTLASHTHSATKTFIFRNLVSV